MIRFLLLAFFLASPCFAQECDLYKPKAEHSIVLCPLKKGVKIDIEGKSGPEEASFDEGMDVMDWVINATVRVTVGGEGGSVSCGSGTIVGFAEDGSALILTNAHVAGTRQGRIVNVERWDQLGKSYRGQSEIIASGYSNNASIDFALLKARGGWGKGVKPIPMADRDQNCGRITTSGCPRCEWPSTQSIRITKAGSQILEWKPKSIQGRSGSSLLDYTGGKPQVIGLLTWRDESRGVGLGQTSKMVIAAISGKLPTSFERLPAGIQEVGAAIMPQREECDACGKDECT